MNGFTNAILSLLLGWLRSFLSAMWSLFTSDEGGAWLQWLGAHWKIVFLVLCVGGFVTDRMIYLIRWRPFSARRIRREQARYDDEAWAEPSDRPYAEPYGSDFSADFEDHSPVTEFSYTHAAAHEASYDADPNQYTATEPFAQTQRYPARMQQPLNTPPLYHPESTGANGAAPESFAYPDYVAADPMSRYAQPPVGRGRAAYAQGEELPFSPNASFAPTVSRQMLSYPPSYDPEAMTDEPRYDEVESWNAPGPTYAPLGSMSQEERNPAAGMIPVFGASQPEPTQYLQDVQAGYAPQPSPEARYAPRAETMPGEPVHPGLDLETFQQNIGITNPEALETNAQRDQALYPNFAPFPAARVPETPEVKQRRLGSLAKRARSFVSGEDERNPLTIRDLQSTVDVKNAFHAPVYPKRDSQSEDE